MPGGSLLLGIDGGQTSTKALVARSDGRVLASGLGGPSDHFHALGGEHRNRVALHGAIASALRAAGAAPADVVSVALGLTGAPTAPGAPRLAEAIVRELLAPRAVRVVADYVTNLAGASGGKAGVVVIAGGGSIAYGVAADGREAIAGGFGFLLGDEGSAFDIGRRAIAAAARASDGRGPATGLAPMVRDAFGLGAVRDVTQVVYHADFARDRVSLLAPRVAALAIAGDRVAAAIFEQAGIELATVAVAVLERIAPSGAAMAVYLTGGVFAAGRIVRTPFETELARVRPAATIREPAFPPVVGSLILAARLAGVATDERWFENVAASLPG